MIKTRCAFLIAFLAVWALALTPEIHAQVVIKLGTVAPKDSTWYRILETMGERWKQASGGKVELRIRAGTAGDESDIMRRIRVGQLQAGAVTTVGLSTIDPVAQALHIPLAFKSQEELDYVQSRITVRMEAILQQKGFVVLNWGDAGWVRFFTKSPVVSPADLKRLKLFVWAAGKSSDDIWKDNGFQPVALSSVDILPGLQTGMITAIQVPPLAALSNQWFAITRYMTDLRWAPLTGATIITRAAWEQIPADIRPVLAKIARESGDQMQKEIRTLEQQAIDAMVKRGLQIVKVTPEAEREWQAIVEAIYPRLRGEFVPAEYFDEVLKLRDEYRHSRRNSGK
ncbi:MAG: TRAP transporter substrate-binding protein DctP [Acidobacteriota bacterium]